MKKIVTQTCDYGHRHVACFFDDASGQLPDTCPSGHHWVAEETNTFIDRARIQIIPLASRSPGNNNIDPAWDEAFYLVLQSAVSTEKYMPRFVFSMGQIVEVLERVKKLPYQEAVKRVDSYCKHKQQAVMGAAPDHICGL